MTYNTGEITDIHQSNNVSNATQERLQESNEEPEMRDNCCQTRESLFESRIPDAVMPLGFTTFGVRPPSSQNGTNHLLHHHHYHQAQPQQQSPQRSHPSVQSSQPSLQLSQPGSQQQISQCSGCSPASRGRDGSMGVCPKHNPIPAPPGWSAHESSYPLSQQALAQYPEQLDYPSYQRYQSPKASREPSGIYRQSPKFVRQPTVGSGERYGSSIYGSGHGSNTTSSVSQHSSSGTSSAKRQQGHPAVAADPRYRAEAVIEVDQRRPFSIESTKSAPDVIATHWRRGPGDWEPYKRRHPRQNQSAAVRNENGNVSKATVATQSSLDDDASTCSTVDANSSSWSTLRDALDRARSSEQSPAMDNDERDRAESSENGGRFKDGHVEEVVNDPAKSEAGDASSSNSIIILNGESRCLDGTSVLQSTSRVTVWPKSLADSPPTSRTRVLPEVALKLHDLPILRPPEAFRVPVFRCRTPSLSWQHCECLSHTHLPPRRSSISRSAFERFSTIPMYRTWPNRAARRFGRPSRRTVGTQSSLDGARSSLGVLRCVVRSIDMTERSLDQEIGVSIPF